MEECTDIQNVLIKLESSLPICRICLDISMEYIEFEAPLCVVNGEEITYSDGFKELSAPFSELPKHLPTNFCATCGNDLLNAYLFLKRMENANFILSKVKRYTDESMKDSAQKDNQLIAEEEEPDSCVGNLKVEIFPDLLENEFTKFIDNEDDAKVLVIQPENEMESFAELQSLDGENVDDLPIASALNESEADADDSNYGQKIMQEGSIWMCDECGEVCETRKVLASHRKKHNSKEDIVTTCEHCDRIFLTSEQLSDHLLFHEYSTLVSGDSEKMVHRCMLCEKSCRTEADFVDHINVHRGTKPHVCNFCSSAFHTKHNLRLHRWRVHTSRDLKRKKAKECEKCQHCQRIVRKSHMEKHMVAHSATKDFPCSHCGKEFATKFGLKAHSVVHNQRKFVCHICDKVCLTDFTLRKHIQYIHLSDRKKYQCEDCGLVFQYPSYLKDHQRKHNTKNRFQCPHCERSYCRKPQLDIHMRYHTNDYRYKCDQCDKCYVTKSNLMDHIRSRHTKITYDCDKCDQKFKSVTGLRKHKYTHTGYPYICPLCSVGQTSRSGMKAHLFGVHRDAVTEEEFNEMFPIIVPKTGYRRPRVQIRD